MGDKKKMTRMIKNKISTSFSLKEGKGILPTLEGYDPRIEFSLPNGYTAEYYGDDTIYIGRRGIIVSQIMPDAGVSNKTNKTRYERNEAEFGALSKKEEDVVREIEYRIMKAVGEYPDDTYAIEDFSSEHLMMKG